MLGEFNALGIRFLGEFDSWGNSMPWEFNATANLTFENCLETLHVF